MAGSSLRLISFDVTNTLIQVRGSVGEFYKKAALRFGIEVDSTILEQNFRSGYRDFNRKYPNFGAQHGLSSEKWWNGVVKSTFKSANAICTEDESVLDALSSSLYREFVDSSHWEVFPESRCVLEHLFAKGYCLGVISNFDERLEEILEALHLSSFFSFIVCSVKARTCKPSPEIFQLALKKANVEPNEALHIGDNFLLDYKPATELGMKALVVDRFSSYDGTTAVVDPMHIIKNLNPLLSL